MNILFFSDLHLSQNSFTECEEILNEIIKICEEHQVDYIIDLGDTFDSLKPSSNELDLFSDFLKRLDRPTIILAANSHESETENSSIVNHFGILKDGVEVKKEYHDATYLYCGHFSLKESSKNYDSKLSAKDLSQYKYVFLGHIHSFQQITKKIWHLGSCRWINFDEAKDEKKYVALLTEYQTTHEKLTFLALKSPIPMKEAYYGTFDEKVAKMGYFAPKITDLEAYLSKLDPKTKVKVIIGDFSSFREFLPLVSKYEKKFYLFHYETKFEIQRNTDLAAIRAKNEMTTFTETFKKWIEEQKIDNKVKDILLGEIK